MAIASFATLVITGLGSPPATAAPALPNPGAWPALAAALEPIVAEAAADGLAIGVFVGDVSEGYGGQTLYLGEQSPVTTASTIKLSLAATVMQQVESGRLSLSDVHTLSVADRVGGSGSLQDNAFPQDVSVGTMLELMITISDNTATNKLVDVVGGFTAINALTESVGIAKEDLHFGRKMFGAIVPPDGDLWLTPHGMAQLLDLFYDTSRGSTTPGFLSATSAAHVIDLMRDQQVNTKLGAVIPRSVLANKTGENADVSHDLGYVLLPGQEVSIGVFTRSLGAPFPAIQEVANPYVQRIGAAVYAYLLENPPVTLPDKDACKRGGWAMSTKPVFANQGRCVSYFTAQR